MSCYRKWTGECALALGFLLIGFLLKTLIESRKENDHPTSVIRSLSYSMQAPALLQSHGGGIGITSDGGQLVLSSGDLPDKACLSPLIHEHINTQERLRS